MGVLRVGDGELANVLVTVVLQGAVLGKVFSGIG